MPIVDIANLRLHFAEQGDGEVRLIFPDSDLAAAEYEEERVYFGHRYRTISCRCTRKRRIYANGVLSR